jgi:hypothetical protein
MTRRCRTPVGGVSRITPDFVFFPIAGVQLFLGMAGWGLGWMVAAGLGLDEHLHRSAQHHDGKRHEHPKGLHGNRHRAGAEMHQRQN